jgi:hypothetical protein
MIGLLDSDQKVQVSDTTMLNKEPFVGIKNKKNREMN